MPTTSSSHGSSSGSGRVAIVTGGSRGIGRGIVGALLEAGDTVHFCSRNETHLAATLKMFRDIHGDRVQACAVDVRNVGAVETFVNAVISEHQRIDVLVNNAGVSVFAPVHNIPVEQFYEVIETNLIGPFLFMRAVTRKMKAQGHGFIINIGSVSSNVAIAGGAAYNASKFGLRGLTEAAMFDLRHHGIRVTSIYPGSVATDFSGPAATASSAEDSNEAWKIQPEDIGQTVLDLLALPPRVLPTYIELRPTKPPKK